MAGSGSVGPGKAQLKGRRSGGRGGPPTLKLWGVTAEKSSQAARGDTSLV